MRPTQRRYVYTETADEIIIWAEDRIRRGMLDRPPNNKCNFPYYMEKYIKHLKK